MSIAKLVQKTFRPACTTLVAALTLSGCAIHPLPSQQLAGAREAVASAAFAGAGTHAAGDLKRAREKLALTQRWLAAKDYEPVLWLAEQAQVDAELAAMKEASLRARQAGAPVRDDAVAMRRIVYTYKATGAPS